MDWQAGNEDREFHFFAEPGWETLDFGLPASANGSRRLRIETGLDSVNGIAFGERVLEVADNFYRDACWVDTTPLRRHLTGELRHECPAAQCRF